MYCLAMFYYQFHDDLAQVRPLAKFASIKLVVFMTFWQGVLLAGLVWAKVITETETYTTEQSSEGVQDFLICLEMLIAAIGYKYAYPAKEFYNPGHISTVYQSGSDHFMALVWPYSSFDKVENINVTPEEKKSDDGILLISVIHP